MSAWDKFKDEGRVFYRVPLEEGGEMLVDEDGLNTLKQRDHIVIANKMPMPRFGENWKSQTEEFKTVTLKKVPRSDGLLMATVVAGELKGFFWYAPPRFKRCPFCGGKPEIIPLDKGVILNHHTGHCVADMARIFDTEQEAYHAWNKRA